MLIVDGSSIFSNRVGGSGHNRSEQPQQKDGGLVEEKRHFELTKAKGHGKDVKLSSIKFNPQMTRRFDLVV